MTDALFPLIAEYGNALLFAVTFFSCLAVPAPSSLMMLTGGAFAASGDLPLASTVLSAYAGALGGDQLGYLVGRRGAAALERRLAARPRFAARVARARALTERWGGTGIFLSRWLFSPLGPYVNFASGAMRFAWSRFSAWGAAGEAVWVALYVGLGYLFTGQLAAVAEVATDVSGLAAGAAVAFALGLWLRAALKGHARRH